MTEETDTTFFDRADAHIDLSNAQMNDIGRGKVSASMLYGTARFNAWIAACNCDSQAEMRESRADIIDYFVDEYRKMLEENVDDYIKNFDRYLKPPH